MKGHTMDIERLSAISPDRFACDYLRANRPVVVTDALTSWNLEERWTPGYLERELGDERVQVYNSYFDLKKICSLRKYFEGNFGRDRAGDPKGMPYVRWYTKLRDVEFCWADEAFRRFRDNWAMPYFLPTTDYVLPYVPVPERADPTVARFPAKGLFISGKSARTGLHVDPWGSDAVLCQLYGTKRWVMYHPEDGRHLREGDQVVELDRPDRAMFPEVDRARVAYDFVLHPGETVFVPHDWYHAVTSETDSISLTWNFVHRETVQRFLSWLQQPMSELDRSVLRFFFAAAVGGEVTPSSIADLLGHPVLDRR
jgi:Cupin-like domain